jgi:signal transduction histidine kinase/ActR/RegA family two-component response regulator/HAMP domain-containing protein
VRGIASVVTAVAKGDLKHKVVFEAKGEIAALADTINGMIDTLATFGDQVTNVAREVGIEGKLGGQAKVPGAAGLWRGLTDNVNQLAANLTGQVRSIAEVATAVTKGDLTRSIMVEAQGEVAALKDNINEMIRNLADTTRKNTEQDWLKTNLANFSRTLQGHRDLVTVSRLILSELAPLVNAQQGVFYTQTVKDGDPRLELLAVYASKPSKNMPRTLRLREGLIGQCASEKKRILLTDVPNDYIRVSSALGGTSSLNVIILPVLFEGEVKAVIELASYRQFNETHLSFLDQLTGSIGVVFNTIEANMRTEDLLKQSQSLTAELQSQQEELKNTNDRLGQQAHSLRESETLLKKQQEELQHTNQELQDKARLLSEQMKQVEYKNREVELAKAAVEEKAEQLSLSSRYKSEFLANMSHELRTPLNSLLILAQLLSDNATHNLSPKQIDYANTIYAAGNDLLSLINDILDLAKIESGTVTLNIAPERFSDLVDFVERTFRQVAHDKDLEFTVVIDPDLPLSVQTDVKRLQQILKNLLSNAFKFTEKGAVSLQISVEEGRGRGAAQRVAFSVTDTGIGIPANKQKLIFEAFQQADGTTSRQYGGTGLGLSISRELTRLLGGQIEVESSFGAGSTFTLYLPLNYNKAGDMADELVETKFADAEPTEEERAGRGDVFTEEAVQALQRTLRNLSPKQRRVHTESDMKPRLTDKKMLIVDDDIRNIFALTSLLEHHGMSVVHAENGKEGIAMLEKNPDVDVVLMDLMMPELDGYDTIRVIRGMDQFKNLPIVAVTAKAMKGDREKCIMAGASEYIAKPVNVDQLLHLLRMQLATQEKETP